MVSGRTNSFTSHQMSSVEWIPVEPKFEPASARNKSLASPNETLDPHVNSEYFDLFFQELLKVASIFTEDKIKLEYDVLENMIHRLFDVLPKSQMKQIISPFLKNNNLTAAETGDQIETLSIESNNSNPKPARVLASSIATFLIKQLLHLLRPILPATVYNIISGLQSGPINFGYILGKLISLIKKWIGAIFKRNINESSVDNKNMEKVIKDLIDQLNRILKNIPEKDHTP